ncbi:MAG: flagellar basal body rod protein FlgC [Verrucomicrobiota bacterium]|jgi:flagellar basal-body rod protein FlgC
MDVLAASHITASALNAEKLRLDIVAENIANANTTKGADGLPYQRKTVSFQAVADQVFGSQGLQVGVSKDSSQGSTFYNPSHPHADKAGMVTMPNVNLAYEMVDLMSASHSYEANLAVIRNARQMASQALSIGR